MTTHPRNNETARHQSQLDFSCICDYVWLRHARHRTVVDMECQSMMIRELFEMTIKLIYYKNICCCCFNWFDKLSLSLYSFYFELVYAGHAWGGDCEWLSGNRIKCHINRILTVVFVFVRIAINFKSFDILFCDIRIRQIHEIPVGSTKIYEKS